ITDMAQIFLAKRFRINHTNTPGNVSFIINQRIDIYVIENLSRINMKGKKIIMIAALLIISVFVLAACASGNGATDTAAIDANQHNTSEESSPDSQGNMSKQMSSSGEVPAGVQEAENPKYEVGSTAIINVKHMNMEGTSGAEATITGAYDTTAYTVSYTTTTGGEPV